MDWYSLFSHTGAEVLNIKMATGITPAAVLTNNKDYVGTDVIKASPRAINNFLMNEVHEDSLVTLNGYMRIIPAKVLQSLKNRKCLVLNIHPAPINLYPDLRGKDPQERLYKGIQEGKYNYIGAVIHEVDAGVDTGRILWWQIEMATPDMSKEYLYERLHQIGTELWISEFREVFGFDRK